jgi:hypothetical protein
MRCPAPRAAWIGALALLGALAPGAAAQEEPRKQEIIFDELPERSVVDAPFDISARATSGLAIKLEVVSGPAVLDGKKLKLTGEPGLVVIRASQAGNSAWLPAHDAERAFNVRARPAAPAIISAPMGQDVEIGTHVTLSAEASGEPPPAFQWRKNRVPITGATARAYSIDSASASDAGSYDVVVTNASGEVTSPPARIAVTKRHQSIAFQVTATAVPVGQQCVVSATASSGLPVRFQIVSGSATLSGGTLTSQSGGSVVVQAEQSGDATFEAAMPVTETFFFTASQGSHPP